jgi:methionyl-tRNA formyltransferase
MKNKLKSFLIGSVKLTNSVILPLKKRTDLRLIITKINDGYNSDYFNIKEKYKNLEVLETNNINGSLVIKKLKKLKLDIGFCVGWNQIIDDKVFSIPERGIIGHHPSLLPYNRGKHPIIWAFFLGLKETGSTFFKIKKGIDNGEIVNQKKISIIKNKDVGSLYKKIEKVTKEQINEIITCIETNSMKFKSQKISKGNYWRKRDDLDSKIDFRMNSLTIEKLIKALTYPYVGAHILINKKKYSIFKCKVLKKLNIFNNIEPGKVLKQTKKYLIVKSYDGQVKLFVENINFKVKYIK